MNEICRFKVQNGLVTELYSVTQEPDGDMAIHCRRDIDDAGTADVMLVAADAAVRVAAALLLGTGIWQRTSAPASASNVVPLPRTKVIPVQSMQDMVTVGRWPA